MGKGHQWCELVHYLEFSCFKHPTWHGHSDHHPYPQHVCRSKLSALVFHPWAVSPSHQQPAKVREAFGNCLWRPVGLDLASWIKTLVDGNVGCLSPTYQGAKSYTFWPIPKCAEKPCFFPSTSTFLHWKNPKITRVFSSKFDMEKPIICTFSHFPAGFP